MSEDPASVVAARVRADVTGLDAACEALRTAGAESMLVGPALLRALARAPVDAALVWTDATPATLRARLPGAIPIGSGERAWRIPGRGRPIVVRALGTPVEGVLARVALTPLALGLRLEGGGGGAWADPAAALADVRARRLRLADPADALDDPLCVLRAAALVARAGFEVSADDAPTRQRLERAMPAIERAPAAHVTALLLAALLAPGASAGARLLDDVGLRRAWLGAAVWPPEHAPRFEALPLDPALRLLAWLGGARPAALLRRVRLDPATRARLVRLAEHHPLDERQPSLRPRALRRLVERLGDRDLDALVAVRRAELAGWPDREDAARRGARLDALVAGRDALARAASGASEGLVLAIRGRDLIDELGLAPGPAIGRLLATLEGEVAAGRVANARAALIERARAARDRP